MTVALIVTPTELSSTNAVLVLKGEHYRCVIGRSGVKPENEKQEGDGSTPLGHYRILRGFFRADRLEKPVTNGLEMVPITKDMGWEDSSDSPHYNQLIQRGYPKQGEESFWREDEAYNIVLVLDHNGAWPFDGEAPQHDQAKKGKGSAIFIHVMRKDENKNPIPTAGCVAFEQSDLLEILKTLESGHPVSIQNE